MLHATPGNPRATLVADLADAPELPSAAFDCFVCTQTLTYVWPLREAIRTIHRILKPRGVVLATLPGISQLSPLVWRRRIWNPRNSSTRTPFTS